jgi:mannose-1-phosphate guanylyltransferase
MKAFLLSAGKGTRLQPITFDTPKCLIPICGRPLIEYWFDLFELYGINEILINTSYLSEKIRDYVNSHSRGLKTKLTYEENLLGSGGTIKKNFDFVRNEKKFFIFYADNLTNINLKKMLKFHNENKSDFTLAILKVSNPQECGIIEIDECASIISFTEKPENPASNLAFAGIMLSSPHLIDFFPDNEVFDLGYDVLPNIIGKASGYVIEDYLIDIGTIEKLKQAEKDIENNIFIMQGH